MKICRLPDDRLLDTNVGDGERRKTTCRTTCTAAQRWIHDILMWWGQDIQGAWGGGGSCAALLQPMSPIKWHSPFAHVTDSYRPITGELCVPIKAGARYKHAKQVWYAEQVINHSCHKLAIAAVSSSRRLRCIEFVGMERSLIASKWRPVDYSISMTMWFLAQHLHTCPCHAMASRYLVTLWLFRSGVTCC